ncbi:hypothetical protein RFI_37857 [Reticulomyxa filosa]|uniref:Meiosis-specific nuclear structural protein 1 n=1 Tax=Reticulomyxa filosa TaxID=46433 RepID=X6LC60_RETFI|nr:hypothetical protein RFI_37857 [Reticulomyxa filosa]|eukprot:ETN99612.1 hypothetical protein RFI_37857 [Reticulomyxa filosa]
MHKQVETELEHNRIKKRNKEMLHTNFFNESQKRGEQLRQALFLILQHIFKVQYNPKVTSFFMNSIFDQRRTQELSAIENVLQQQKTKEIMEKLKIQEKDDGFNFSKKIFCFVIFAEKKIAMELQKQQRAKELKQFMSEKIRSTSEEVKELERYLKTAYLQKELSYQLANLELSKLQVEQQEKEYKRKMDQQLQKAEENALQQEKDRQQRVIETKQLLEKQLREKELQKVQECQQFSIEKQQIDDIVAKIAKEREEKTQHERRKKDEAKQFIDNYFIEKEKVNKKKPTHTFLFLNYMLQRLIQEKQREQEEMSKLIMWNKMQEERTIEIEKKKLVQLERDQLIYEKVKKDLQKQKLEQEDMENLLNELAEEEKQLKYMQEQRQQHLNKVMLQEQMKQENMEQIKQKAWQKQQEKMEENALKQVGKAIKLLDKFEQDMRLDQLSKERAHAKRMQYRKEVEKVMEEKRKLRELETEINKEEKEKIQTQEKLAKELVEQERLNLLKIHAPILGKYLTQRMAKNENELKIIQQYVDS